MEELIQWIECIEDTRQQSKIRYTVQEAVLIVFCCELCGVNDWENKQVWAEYNLEYLPYENGVPSHDTMQRVMGMICTEYFQQAYSQWIEEFEKSGKLNTANRNLIRKWCISMLKHISFYKPNLSMKQKMFLISLDPVKYLDYVMSL